MKTTKIAANIKASVWRLGLSTGTWASGSPGQ